MIELAIQSSLGEGIMKIAERWSMYLEIRRLKELGLNVSQIARHLGISRNTATNISIVDANFKIIVFEALNISATTFLCCNLLISLYQI